jgi:CTP:molybdopterin cytidylyltransferase MocA
VVLAAGASSRYGGVKQRELLPAVLAALGESSIDDVVVVDGAHELSLPGVRVVRCDDWEIGPGASLRCGLAALPEEAQAAVVVLADGPDLSPEAIGRVVARWSEDRPPVVAATYGGTRLHPVLLDRRAWPDIPDDGARTLDAVLVSCDDLGPPGDVDHADDVPDRLKPWSSPNP